MRVTTQKIKENPSGRSYRAVSCQASNSLYIIQGFKELSNTAYQSSIRFILQGILQYASTLVMAPLPCNSQLHILPINTFDNFSK